MSRTLTLKAAGRTDIGRVRETNQDALLVREDLGLFVVADGMDGRATGEIASAIAVKAIEGFIEPFGTDWPCDTIGAPTDALARLVAAVIHANQRIYQIAVKDPSPRWMGTTVVAALVRRNSVCLAHVGDSRIYRLRNGVVEQMTEDHTVCNARIREGMAPAVAARLPKGAALARVLGTYPRVPVSARAETVMPGDVLLLTCAGIHRVIPPDELTSILIELGDLASGVDRLITRANERGGPDNSTAVLVRWSP